MKLKVLFLSFFLNAGFLCAATIHQLSTKLADITVDMGNSLKTRSDVQLPTPVAVFNFVTSESLERKRVGMIVRDMVGYQLAKNPAFNVLERARLDEVLREQKLELTGAIEAESAAKVGKLLGARFIVMGSVEELNTTYQVNMRLVDATTGEIIKIGYAEVDSKEFASESEPYRVDLKPYLNFWLNEIIVNGSYQFFNGELGHVVDRASGLGVAYRRNTSLLGLEIRESFTSVKANNGRDADLLGSTISGLYYFGSPFQTRGYAKFGVGTMFSDLKASATNNELKSTDPIFVTGLGINFISNKKFGGLLEIDYQYVPMKGDDMRGIILMLGGTYGW